MFLDIDAAKERQCPDLGEGKAHLHAFIVDWMIGGGRIGRRLLEEAMLFDRQEP